MDKILSYSDFNKMQSQKERAEKIQSIEEQFEKELAIGEISAKTEFHHSQQQQQQNPEEISPLSNLCRVCGSPGNISLYISPPEKFMCIKSTPESNEEELTIARMIEKISNEKVSKKRSSDEFLINFSHSRSRRQTYYHNLYAHSALVTSSTHSTSAVRSNRQQKTLN